MMGQCKFYYRNTECLMMLRMLLLLLLSICCLHRLFVRFVDDDDVGDDDNNDDGKRVMSVAQLMTLCGTCAHFRANICTKFDWLGILSVPFFGYMHSVDAIGECNPIHVRIQWNNNTAAIVIRALVRR